MRKRSVRHPHERPPFGRAARADSSTYGAVPSPESERTQPAAAPLRLCSSLIPALPPLLCGERRAKPAEAAQEGSDAGQARDAGVLLRLHLAVLVPGLDAHR